MPKKKNYQSLKEDEEELQKFREHSKLIDEKSKTIIAKYAKWWDKDNKSWKKGVSDGKIL